MDSSDSVDSSNNVEQWVETLSDRLLELAKGAVPPMLKSKPWQGKDYWCATCSAGRPTLHPANATVPVPMDSIKDPITTGSKQETHPMASEDAASTSSSAWYAWEPWCFSPGEESCKAPTPLGPCSDKCKANGCDCDCHCATCKGVCGDGCYGKCMEAKGKASHAKCGDVCSECSCPK